MKASACFFAVFASLASSAFAVITVTSPSTGQTLNSPVSFVATATSDTCASGVASMGVYVDYVKTYVVNGASLNTTISIPPGPHHVVVEEWDRCHGAATAPMDIIVAGVALKSPVSGSTVSAPVAYVATAATTCPQGIAMMGVYANSALVYTVSAATLNTNLNLATGAENTVVQAMDNCGGTASTATNITVVPAAPPTASVTASPTSVIQGSSSTLTVTATNATSVKVTASDGTSYTLQPTGGTLTVTPMASTTYWISATNGTQKASTSTLVQVTPPVLIDYPRYKGDIGGTGANTNEVLLSPATVNSLHFGNSWGFLVDSSIATQPLYVHALTVNGATHNVLFVTTNNDSVYALDANSGAQLWKRSFLATGVTPVNLANANTSLGIDGILGTPVIDTATNTMYVVVWTAENNNTYFPHRLHAIDITTGNDKLPPVTITDPAMAPLYQLQRPGLLLLNRTIYVAFGSVEDILPYHGFLFAFDEATLTQEAVWITTPSGTGGGIWMTGSAPTADSAGNIYVLIGNGSFDGTTNFGESAVKLSPSLSVLDYFTPYNYTTLNMNDVDLGSGSPIVVPDQPGAYPHELIACGKPWAIYLLNRDNMGGVDPVYDNVVQELDSAVGTAGNFRNSGEPCYNSPAVWNNNVYFAANHDVLKMFSISPVTGQLSSTSSGATTYAWPGASPVISSNGNTNGIVWTVEYGTATLHADDATDVSKSLYVSPSMGKLFRWVPPMVVNGYVYVAASNWVVAYRNH